ncbi:Oxysterol-binding protein [Lasiodiplodia theobromae]|uniref:Oxysterol-binding protein n=1 Tax=Lasiodiplodia theobromae TaxID=45133 RepID=A0A5N5CXB3_9PEZI|nr:Oxysterol binding protein [Lasiodiplodia theobromae]KAB2570003.1 Oxysterol-binding protein-like protein [Lasiodiplodia theobromae]KAF4534739.1 Oxysterol binding protein [Lasiodiplodia theobromae]KAF9630034.1 Oxysterol-binding protein [Lasiodiplodia theobromae]
MAGMEQLQIHSKSYLVRWINVPAGHSISWSIQPHKKSVNFGIFKHPGTKNGEAPNLPSTVAAGINDAPQTAAGGETAAGRPRGSSIGANGIGANASRNDRTLVVEKLQSIGLKPVSWTGKCEADKVSMGRYDVPQGEGGMYGLVFDNTFSKQVSKTATFVLMTHPTNAAPKSGHHLHFSQAVGGASPSLPPGDFGESTDSLAQEPMVAADPRPRSRHVAEATTPGGSLFYTGVLLKKRRKRNQGYARRFFSLDFTSSTLSYYQSRSSSALRGAIPLSLAAIAADEKTREISVDSGAEVWHLKANNAKDFEAWKDALERASSQAGSTESPEDTTEKDFNWPTPGQPNSEQNDRDWGRIEALVGRVSGIRDAVRRLAKDTDPKNSSTAPSGASSIKGGISDVTSPAESADSGDYFKPQDDDARSEKKSSAFWKRKPSASAGSVHRKSITSQIAPASPPSVPPVPPIPTTPGSNLTVPKVRANGSGVSDENIHENVLAILRDLDYVVSESASLLTQSRLRRAPTGSHAESRRSIDSVSEDEFFDATGGDEDDHAQSKLLTIRRDSNDDTGDKNEEVSDGESEASSEGEGTGAFNRASLEGLPGLFPPKPKSLTPLPLDKVQRRTTIAAPKVAPPSLIAFLRKNVGKDLSTIAMPVSANEPTSLLQRVAEQMEYSELIDAAVNAPAEDGSRILYIMAFAISSFSNARVKERAIRKPFNPMLGETFELVREDKGFRFLAEKVSHRPVRMACQAEAKEWTFLQSPMPVQKFWGKSAELNTDGRARVFLHNPNPNNQGEHYSWTVATSFLRNIIAGEKYVEPVGTMTVVNETTGAKAIATFKAGGMFAGRSEEVTVQAFAPPDQGGAQLSLGLAGKWTAELHFTRDGADTKQTAWKAGGLVDQAEKRYGFTTFAAGLNEITAVEEGKIAPTDSRLRQDQRAVEEGDLDRAEAVKAKLEERQRQRRRVMEEHGQQWSPRWFVKVAGGEGAAEDGSGGEEEWRLKAGKDGYWEERAAGKWTNVVEVLDA